MRRLVLAVAGCLGAAPIARAEPANAIYLEVLGRGGLWGFGYDRRIVKRVRVGAVGSGGSFEYQRYVSFSPYVGVDLLRLWRIAWFADGGVQGAHVWSKSPVPEWSGSSSTGVAGTLSTGIEFRSRLLFRVFGHLALGKGGVLPWVGADIGFTF